ncbi:M23 family metallopeptidase [Rhodothermus marinus]|uniref:Peptidase M23 n=1 Tax=Rhodothermus marinus (strain ATCC 43812 / DSM 4252 / R-10) TaxID=518766 RepID=D0MFU0_RHOM4|nr:M23 family metallopeptidase [Rhodothermus marinus]ACY49429.1 Peptidase M23 [Rhodothermus marinus DSM 4252]
MPKNRYYYFDHTTCSFVEVRPHPLRRLLVLASLVVFLLGAGGFIFWYYTGRLATPRELALEAENEALRAQLSRLSKKLDQFSARLNELAAHDQSLYRTLLDAEPISEDVWQVGVGGTDTYAEFDRFSKPTATLLRETAQKLDALERRIALQNASYRELVKLAEAREAWRRQMPALLPADGVIVSGFGMRLHPILRVRKMHEGIDILLPYGSPVYAPGDGIVRKTGRSAGYGLYIILEHPATGYRTLYGHLSKVLVRRGQKVQRGDQIALSGNSGRSTGPHLHYEVRDSRGRALNPLQFVAPSMTPHQYQQLLEAAENSRISLD